MTQTNSKPTAHTAGPWLVGGSEKLVKHFSPRRVYAKMSDTFVCIADADCSAPSKDCEANAHLIAAAPLMKEALEVQTAVIEMWKAAARGESDVTDEQLANATNAAIEQGRAALKAAEGK